MNVVTATAGALLVVAVLRDVFHTLFHPAGRGSIAMSVFRAVWAITGRLGPSARRLSGPTALAGVIALWTAMLIVGWALIYRPSLPTQFVLASGLDPDRQDGFLDAVYFSWVTQATLGFGDIAPTHEALRMLAPLQATIGFGIFTAAVTWVLSVYPALQRQRALAGLARTIVQSHRRADGDLRGLHAPDVARQFQALAQGITSARIDFVQYPSTFYFDPPDDASSLPRTLGDVSGLASTASSRDELQLASRELEAALEMLAEAVASQFLGTGASVQEVLQAWREHESPRGGEG